MGDHYKLLVAATVLNITSVPYLTTSHLGERYRPSRGLHIGSCLQSMTIRYTRINDINTLVLILPQKAIHSHRYKSSFYFATNDQAFGKLFQNLEPSKYLVVHPILRTT